MGKSSKISAAPAAVAPAGFVAKGKAGKKRQPEDEIEKAVSAKKQKEAKAETLPKEAAKKQPPAKNAETSSSEEESAKSEEEVKCQTKRFGKSVKQESSDDSGSESSDQEHARKPSAKPLEPAARNDSKKVNQESSEDEIKLQTKKAAKPVKQESSDDSSDESYDEVKVQTKRFGKSVKQESSDDSSDDEPKKDGAISSKAPKEEPQTPGGNQHLESATKTLYVGNLSSDADPEDLKSFFAVVGDVVGVRLPKDNDGRGKGFGYVDFSTANDMDKALGLDGEDFNGMPVRLDVAIERTPSPRTRHVGKHDKITEGPNLSVYVKGFDTAQQPDAIKKSLKDHFSRCGEVEHIRVPVDRTGKTTGIAFVEFKDKSAVKSAIKLSGGGLAGTNRNLYVAPRRDGGRSGVASGGCEGGRGEGGMSGRGGGRRGKGTTAFSGKINFDND